MPARFSGTRPYLSPTDAWSLSDAAALPSRGATNPGLPSPVGRDRSGAVSVTV